MSTRAGALAGLLCAILWSMLAACGSPALVTDVYQTRSVIRPNGVDLDHETRVGFRLARRADVSLTLATPDGREIALRERVTRAPDEYEVSFDGTVPTSAGNRRVLENGAYRLKLLAEDDRGARFEWVSALAIQNADTASVAISELQLSVPTISPNYDGIDDDVRITYQLTKDAEVTVYVTDPNEGTHIIEPPTKRVASLRQHLWDGTTGGRIFGGKLLPDGEYVIHVEGRDVAGNVSHAAAPIILDNGGTPRLEITDVKFWPIAVPLSGTLNVRVRVKNTGTTNLKTQGPPSGTKYATDQTYASLRDPSNPNEALFFERPGVWRVGITWDNAPQEFPLRWALFDDPDRQLGPGEEATVEGQIVVVERVPGRRMRFWAGVIQEGVGYPGGRLGQTVIALSY